MMDKIHSKIQPNIKRTTISDPDRISMLPDDILCQILSCLPSKYAVRTSVLSSRWTHLMKFVPVLKFQCNSAPAPSFKSTLKNLLSNNRSAGLQELQLRLINCNRSIVPLVNDWVHSALQRNVVSLDVYVTNLVGKLNKIQNGTLGIIASDSIQVLQIRGELCVDMPTSGCFDKLKKFDVQLNDPNAELLAKLFCSLPQLEDLAVRAKFSTSRKDLKICINIILPALKVLYLNIVEEKFNNVDFDVLIDTPLLESIFLGDDYMASYSLKCPYSIVTATLFIGQKNHEMNRRVWDLGARAIELIRGLSYVECLSVSNNAPLALADPILKFPLLQRLIDLEMDFVLPSCGSKALPKLLENAPNLKGLILKVPAKLKDSSDWEWTSPKTFPTCLLHLETIKIEGAANVKWGYAKPFKNMVGFIEKSAPHHTRLILQ